MRDERSLPGAGRNGCPPAGLSRRRFLKTAAAGAAAATLGLPTVARALDSFAARAICARRQSSYLPRLEILDGADPLASPDVWAVQGTDPAAPRTSSFGLGQSYLPAALVRNTGTAPVINALVNFYVWSFIGGPLPGPAFGRSLGTLLGTRYVHIESRSERVVVSPAPVVTPPDLLGEFPGPLDPLVWFVIVETFEPLTDPPVGAGPRFLVGADRQVAAHGFEIRGFRR